MENIDYLNSKSYLVEKALELANAVSHVDEQLDTIYKINFYLIRRYKDDLIKEFNVDEIKVPEEWNNLFEKVFNTPINTNSETIKLQRVFNCIKDKMKEEMPEPWYCYGIGG